MPTDYVVHLFYSWIGLVLLGLHAAVVVGIWAVVAEPKSSGIGMSPLVTGGLLSAGIALALAFFGAIAEYTGRTSTPGAFWNIVPGWTAYLFALYASLSALALTILGVPAAAIWVRRGHRTFWSFTFLLLCCSVVAFALGFAFAIPSLIGFFAGVWITIHFKRRRGILI